MILILLRNYPILQTSGLMIIFLSRVACAICWKPFLNKSSNYLAILNSGGALLAIYASHLLANENNDAKVKHDIGWFSIINAFFNIAVHLLNLVYS